jgi:FkbM family methyltransferase
MSSAEKHPAIATFENLIALRDFVGRNPRDAGAHFLSFCAANFTRSWSQLFQDLFVIFLLKGKRNGFFVEFGATNGLNASNTVVLERDFQWKGILAEPAKCWHSALKTNRSVAIDLRCVWSQTGSLLEFKETEAGELSTLAHLVDSDFNRNGRIGGRTYEVETVSLNDLLTAHSCPQQIDYLSIDTEGSELEILRSFNFSNYDIGIISVEHNFREPDRRQISQILTSKGYVRLFEELSKFDDWYVKRSVFGL